MLYRDLSSSLSKLCKLVEENMSVSSGIPAKTTLSLFSELGPALQDKRNMNQSKKPTSSPTASLKENRSNKRKQRQKTKEEKCMASDTSLVTRFSVTGNLFQSQNNIVIWAAQTQLNQNQIHNAEKVDSWWPGPYNHVRLCVRRGIDSLLKG